MPAILSEYRKPLFTVVSGLPWELKLKTIRNRDAMRREVWGRFFVIEFRVFDRCAASCFAGSTGMPRAGKFTDLGRFCCIARVMAVAAAARRTRLRSWDL